MFGEIAGVDEGWIYPSRRAAYDADVHRALQSGIVGTGATGAESVVLSGGYPDIDEGSRLLYTGHGGLDRATRNPIAHQTFEAPGNAALETSRIQGMAVRVIRKVEAGYRYDGLYRVEESMLVYPEGKPFKVCRFEMVKIDKTVDALYTPIEAVVSAEVQHPDQPIGNPVPGRRSTSVQRIIRATKVSDWVKDLYDNTCQMCGIRLAVGKGAYSEGAHIQALGGLHQGEDRVENMLCLCPNCHVLFDAGALVVQEDRSLQLNGAPAVLNGKPADKLHVHNLHIIGDEFLTHHREAHQG
ncbi:YDG/SRA domain-containing protein [Amycolatopsis rhabdoformis]|uniref:YDG/SRA domain-containing protein n=1 Tax=Amycolatopsis rhabdoformis TaxID=1448059 RepID=A0ABZ1I1L4_9PSEU|nr:YDG/SRA domain-containing protein [Amycolatopsis rhabdoformis]WSE28258.1 YDG/SRA domain-containing protein [Amycolatopsis rhabdoformis]